MMAILGGSIPVSHIDQPIHQVSAPITEPQDIQPALGVNLYQDTISPQQTDSAQETGTVQATFNPQEQE